MRRRAARRRADRRLEPYRGTRRRRGLDRPQGRGRLRGQRRIYPAQDAAGLNLTPAVRAQNKGRGFPVT